MKNIITIKNLNVTFGNNQVLKNITANIAPEEVVAIIGPNGSGKTTLLRAILGLVPYTGTIKILNKPVKQILNQIGYVPQRFNFDRTFPITVNEFLTLCTCKHHKQKSIDKSLKELEIAKLKDQMIGTLSGGQMQRVLIASAIIHEPKILLFDEPTSGIDIEGVKDFYSIIKHLNENHKTTVLMISHEISMVYKFAHKILCLNKGLVCHGKPSEALTSDVLKKLYGEKVEFREHTH